MQCSSVTDSTSTTRACCSCSDSTLCPFSLDDDLLKTSDPFGYCGVAATNVGCPRDDTTCRALAAGCGVSLYDVNDRDGDEHCDEWDVREGSCNACRQPAWCDDVDADDWIDRYHGTDYIWARGNIGRGTRQCKYKSEQKATWMSAMRARYEKRRRDGYDQVWLWNEVNFYSDPEDDLKHILWARLIGFVVFRNIARDEDLGHVRNLVAHLSTLPGGRDVPIFAMNVQGNDGIESTDLDSEWWEPTRRVDLTAPPFNLELVLPFPPPPSPPPKPPTSPPSYCQNWCERNAKPWSHKCALFKGCVACPACLPANASAG